jgi:type II secretory pathway component PulK
VIFYFPPVVTMKNNVRGSILIVVVGILGLLVLMTVSIGRRANQELGLIKYSLQKMQSRYLAWAGFYNTLNELRQDGLDEIASLNDNIYTCGFKLPEGKTPEDLFKEVKLGNGWFNVTTGTDPFRYGMGDEDGKLNLNALNLQNYGIFTQLLMIAGIKEQDAVKMAAAALDWMDEDSQPAFSVQKPPEQSQEQESEGSFSFDKIQFIAKNRPFDQVYELMFIPGMTPEIYEKIKPWVTVFPRQAQGVKINLATASVEILLALSRSFTGSATNTSVDDADSLIKKLTMLRAGSDRIDGTADDQPLVETKMNLTAPEQTIFRAMAQVEAKTSRFVRFRVGGFEMTHRRQSYIDAVVDRETLTVVSWRNN